MKSKTMMGPLWLGVGLGALILTACGAGSNGSIGDEAMTGNPDDDPHLWLEEVTGEEALAWVEKENQRTVERLEAHPSFQSIYDDTLEDLTRSDRLPSLQVIGDFAYDLLQDAEHVRGLWRRTPVADYVKGETSWEGVLDIDALGEADGESWVFKGAICLDSAQRCMLTLSPGGSDSAVYREFDLQAKSFVDGGFEIPELKGSIDWRDEDTLLVSLATDEASTTTSGYGRVLRSWSRGTPLDEAAAVLEVPKEHMAVMVRRLGGGETGDEPVLLASDLVTIFDHELSRLNDDGTVVKLPLPEGFELGGVVGDVMFGVQKQPWSGPLLGDEPGTVKVGSVIGFDLEELSQGRLPSAQKIIEPADNQAVQIVLGTGALTAGDSLFVAVLEDVVGQVLEFRRGDEGWESTPVDLPGNGAVTLMAAHRDSGTVFVRYENLVTPPTVFAVGAEGSPRAIESLQDRFDPAGVITEQLFATSADGTQVPYFVARRENMAMDGSAPVLLAAYGGFGLSITPTYRGTLSFGSGAPFEAVLDAGGAYVLANIRGGGEYGPEWHQSAILENRQRVYEDFHAVAEDLIARGYTSKGHLGVAGASNSGLLVGVAMTQRPDLYSAVLCGVPLLDMRRYHQLLAGASWMGEYGNPDDPEMWDVIRTYSPYHNVKPDVDYPEPFFWGSTKDDRVHPGHARKMAARMREHGHDFLFFEQTEGGHGSADLSQLARLEALQAVYVLGQLTGP